MTTYTTEAAVRAAVLTAARGEVGKHYGLVGGVPNPTPYGRWYGGTAWERALFCAAGATWCWARGLGEADATRAIGYQTHGGTAPLRRGYVWTVAMWEQHRAHRVPLSQLQPGDFVLYKYPTSGGRNTNVVNHVDLVESNHPSLGYVDCIGFNVPRPGAPAGTDQSRGGGVWRRRTYYGNTYVVGGLRMPAAGIAEHSRREWSQIQHHLTALGLADLQGTGTVGPATLAGVAAYATGYGYTGSHTDRTTLLAHLEDTMSSILDRLARLEAHAGIGTTPPAPAPTPEPTPNWRRVKAPNGLNIRSGPGAQHPIVSSVGDGERWLLSRKDGAPITKDGWVMGRSDAMRDAGAAPGWVSGRFLEEA